MAKTADKTRAKAPAPKAKATAKPKAAKPRAAKASAPTTSGAWSLPRPPFHVQGYAFGMAYPSVLFHAALPPTTPEERGRLLQRFEALLAGAKGLHQLPEFADPATGSGQEDTVKWFAALADRLQQLANLPVYSKPRMLARSPKSVTIAVPALNRGIAPTVELLTLACNAFALPDMKALPSLRDKAAAAFAALKASQLTTSNTPRLVKAAVENGIAFQELPGSMVIYGIGRKSVLMDSTFTHECSNIGTRLAKFKHLAALFLRRAGLPAPANGLAADEAQALQLARQFGFPVVVKPADKDGGIGVQADLRNEDEVRWAFEAARKVSGQVLVEQFVEGRDYRIVVFRGKAIWAKEREPGGVTGDGASTVRALVEAINADPRRGSDVNAPLKKLKLDDEAEKVLARDGLTFDSVPEAGQLVRLRGRANVSAGGVPKAVTDRMHPDNARLAERAAEVIGLDLAGVDLIIPDIATSWREVPASICEINAQPELGGDAEHLYPQVLKALVQGDGHIPTIAVLGATEAERVTAALVVALKKHGLCVGVHDRAGVHVGDETIVSGEVPLLRAGRMLTLDRRVDALVLGTLDANILSQGLPVQQIDALLVTGELPPEPEFASGNSGAVVLEMLRMAAPHCRTAIALAPAEEFDPLLRDAVRRTIKIQQAIAKQQRAPAIAQIARRMAAAATAR